ncbi:MAG: 4Fe-4S binding protein [Deltaproteobacteria bacterium]|jgi:2-oxoglutarate ferredoxin oxidoreductase subunit delta|nr:4Fe-4S binding protein [Deltaproteobacteria bacterium]
MTAVSVNAAWCKGCGICVAFCPKNTLELDRAGKALQAKPDDCIRCGMCALYCPDLAVSVDLPPAKGKSPRQEAQA